MNMTIDIIRLIAWGAALAIMLRYYWQFELEKARERKLLRDGRNLEGKFIRS